MFMCLIYFMCLCLRHRGDDGLKNNLWNSSGECLCVCVCKRKRVCPCTHALSDWPCAWADSPSVLACLWGRWGKRGSGCVCVRIQTPKPCQRVMREWESVFGKHREGLGHVRWSHCLCMLLHDEGNAPLPLFLPRSFVLSFWTSSQETLPLSPLSQSPKAIDYPCPVPKQAGKKSAICTTAVFQPFTVLASLAPQKERDLQQKRETV